MMKRVYYEFLYVLLTPVEMRIIALMVQGYTAEQIATKLGIKAKTVTNHQEIIYSKLGIHSAILIILIAERQGFDDKGFYKGENLFEGIALKALPKGTDKKIEDWIAWCCKEALQNRKGKNNG